MPSCSVQQQRGNSIIYLNIAVTLCCTNNRITLPFYEFSLFWLFLLHSVLLSGKDGSKDLISSSAKAVDELITGLSKDGSLTQALQLPFLQSILAARDELHSALQCLHSWNHQAGENSTSAISEKSTSDEILTTESATTHRAVRNRVKTKIVCSIPPGLSSNGNTHWV